MKQIDDYQDIIGMAHHVSDRHSQMPMSDRAAQFSPFAALTGYHAAVEETARYTDRRIELDESEREQLDWQLRWLAAHIEEQPQVRITYFRPDAYKEGGSYVTVDGVIRKLDYSGQCLWLADGERIPVADIMQITVSVSTDDSE